MNNNEHLTSNTLHSNLKIQNKLTEQALLCGDTVTMVRTHQSQRIQIEGDKKTADPAPKAAKPLTQWSL